MDLLTTWILLLVGTPAPLGEADLPSPAPSVHTRTLESPRSVGEVVLPRRTEVTWEGGRVSRALPSRAVRVGPVRHAKGEPIRFEPDGRVVLLPTRDFDAAGLRCAADTDAVLWPDATLAHCHLAADGQVGPISITARAGGTVSLHPDGTLRSATLSAAHTFDSWTLPPGSIVVLDPHGHLEEAVLGAPLTRDGRTLPAATHLTFDPHGLLAEARPPGV